MATVKAALSLYDGMTQPLKSIHNALNTVLNSFEAVQTASGNAVDVSAIQEAREELARSGATLEQIENNIRQADHEQEQFNRHIRDGEAAADGLGKKLKSVLTVAAAVAAVKMGMNWAKENMELADTQRNAENQLAAVLANMGVESVEIPITANTEQAMGATESLSSAFDTLAGVTVQPGVDVDTGAAVGQLEGVNDTLATLSQFEGVQIGGTVTFDDSAALSNLTNYVAMLDQVNGMNLNNTVTLNTAGAVADFEAMNATFADPVDVIINSNTEQAIQNISTFSGELNRLNGTNVKTTLTVGVPNVNRQYDQLSALNGNRLTNTLTLDTGKAVSSYTNLLETVENGEPGNTLALHIEGALESYEGLIQTVEKTDLENTLTLDTMEAAATYETFVDNVSGGTVTLALQMDTTQTVSAFDAITAKASEIQSRGIYGDEAMIAGAAELATYFTDAEAIMSMMDTLSNYAMGMSGGGELDASAMVDYATNLGKIMTGAYDAMTKKGFQFTDAQKAIIEGTATEAQYVEALGDQYASMSEDMRAATVINDIIAESWDGLYETMSNTPEGKIIQFNNTVGDLRETMGNKVYPAVLHFFDVFQQRFPEIEQVMGGITSALSVLIQILTMVAELGLNVATVFTENWSWIAPLILGIAGAFAVYYGALTIYNGIQAISTALTTAHAFAEKVKAASTAMATGATFAETVAQQGLNAALLACPLVWIIMLIVALIGVFYAAVATVIKFAGTSVSATGIICGVFMAALAFIGNLFVTLWNLVVDVFTLIYNLVATVANFIGNVFTDPVGAVCRLFFDLADTVLGVLQALASAIDTIFGSNLAGSVQGWRDSLSGWVDSTFGKGEEVMEKMDAESMKLGRFEYSAAFDMGYDFGEGIEDSIGNVFKMPTLEEMGMDSLGAYDLGNQMDGIYGNTGDTAANTAATANALDFAEEDLKYLRDIAEREAINRYTTAEIKVEQHNENHIEKDADLDGIMDAWAADFAEKLDISAEGVHE